MVHIRLITPHTHDRSYKLKEIEDFRDLPIEFSMVKLDCGPESIESEFDEALAAPYVVGRAIEAEQDRVDAVMIDCMGDPGLEAAREAVSIPVLGPGETSLHLAAMLGHKFSFVTVLERIRPMIERRAKIYGVASKMTPVRVIHVPVLNIEDNHEELVKKLTVESIEAITKDHADVIVLGCTGFVGVAEELAERLRKSGHPAPVISPIRVTVMTAFTMLRTGLSHSPLTYPGPADKGAKGFDLPKSLKLRAVDLK